MRNAIITAGLLLLLLGCDDTTSPQVLPTNFYPLAVGNSWTYHRVRYDSMGTILQSFDETIAIVADTIIGDVHWYAYDLNKYSLISRKADGYYLKQADLEGLTWKFPGMIPQRYNLVSNPPLPPDTSSYLEVSLDGTDGVLFTGVHRSRVMSHVRFRDNVGMTSVVTYWYRSNGDRTIETHSDLTSRSIH